MGEQKEKREERWDGMNEKENSGTPLVVQWLRNLLLCRGQGADPWFGKIPHAVQQLRLCAAITESAL